MPTIVALDDPDTWPPTFCALVEDVIADTRSDDWFDRAAENAAREALSSARVRVYHCTRLTPREVASVRAEGLRPLSPEFTEERLRNAVHDGHLSEEEAAFYGRTTLPASENRTGMVWFLTERAALSQAPQIGYLVEVWGGEGINMALRSGSPEMERLERIGVPSVVVAGIDLDRHCDYAHPGILAAAVRQLRSGDGGTSIMCRSTVGPESIEAVEHPGGQFWEQYVWTPQGGYRG